MWPIAMENAFYSRWDMVRTDLYYAGVLLNPYPLYNKGLVDDTDSFTTCKKVF
jgi:hypothetical protein